MLNIKRYFKTFVLFILLSGCYTYNNIDGNYIFPDKLSQLKEGMTKKQVFDLLGPATAVSPIQDNTWHYLYEKSERPLKVINKKITDSKIITIKFDEKSLVYSIDIVSEDSRKKIKLDKSETKDTLVVSNPNSRANKRANSF